MLKLLIILVVAIVIAALLLTLLKKVLKITLFIALVVIVFLIISSFVFPETNLFEKGKNYILGKSEYVLDRGKDKLTAYVITETNETINKAKEKVLESIGLG